MTSDFWLSTDIMKSVMRPSRATATRCSSSLATFTRIVASRGISFSGCAAFLVTTLRPLFLAVLSVAFVVAFVVVFLVVFLVVLLAAFLVVFLAAFLRVDCFRRPERPP